MTWADDEAAEAIAAREQRAADELAHLRAELEQARADAAMLRVALRDSQTLLASRSSRWAREKAQLIDVTLDLGRNMGTVVVILRDEAGRGEEPR